MGRGQRNILRDWGHGRRGFCFRAGDHGVFQPVRCLFLGADRTVLRWHDGAAVPDHGRGGKRSGAAAGWARAKHGPGRMAFAVQLYGRGNALRGGRIGGTDNAPSTGPAAWLRADAADVLLCRRKVLKPQRRAGKMPFAPAAPCPAPLPPGSGNGNGHAGIQRAGGTGRTGVRRTERYAGGPDDL